MRKLISCLLALLLTTCLICACAEEAAPESWICVNCGSEASGDVCENCGSSRPTTTFGSGEVDLGEKKGTAYDPASEGFKAALGFLFKPVNESGIAEVQGIGEDQYMLAMNDGQFYALVLSAEKDSGVNLIFTSLEDDAPDEAIEKPYDVASKEFTDAVNCLLTPLGKTVSAITPLNEAKNIYNAMTTDGSIYTLGFTVSQASVVFSILVL